MRCEILRVCFDGRQTIMMRFLMACKVPERQPFVFMLMDAVPVVS